MSAIGNYEIKQPSAAMIAGVRRAVRLEALAARRRRRPRPGSGSAPKAFQAINGHRDAGLDRLPGQLPLRQDPARSARSRPRRSAAGPGASSSPTSPSTPHPDLIVAPRQRRAGLRHPDRRADSPSPGPDRGRHPAEQQRPGGPQPRPHRRRQRRPASCRRPTARRPCARAPAPARSARGSRRSTVLAGHDLVTAVGDLNGDGRNDLVARDTTTGRLDVFLGNGTGGFARARIAGRLGRLRHARRRR